MINYNVLVALLFFVTVEQSVSATWNFNNNPGEGGFSFPGLGRFPKRGNFVFPSWNQDNGNSKTPEQGLREGFYSITCPNAETIVRDTVRAHYNNDPTITAGLLRMFFHDCFVWGSDVSILVDKTPSGEMTEKFAFANGFTLHGEEVIDAAKAALEAACPGIVSCADILSFATRDASVMAGLPNFPMVAGRRDGTVSLASEVPGKLPDPLSNVDKMTKMFNKKGFSQAELVTLLGAHSVGGAHCFTFANRLYNTTDPELEVNLAQQLKSACPSQQNNDITKDAKVDFDPASPLTLDVSYYMNVQTGRGLLTSDHTLMTNPATRDMVARIVADPAKWKRDFSQALVKLGTLDILLGQNGRSVSSAELLTLHPHKISQDSRSSQVVVSKGRELIFALI